jgi:hypothetical protein
MRKNRSEERLATGRYFSDVILMLACVSFASSAFCPMSVAMRFVSSRPCQNRFHVT